MNTVVAVYPWKEEVSKKVFEENPQKYDSDYAYERRDVPRRIMKTFEDGSQIVKQKGWWLYVPTKDVEKPCGHLMNHCKHHPSVKVPVCKGML